MADISEGGHTGYEGLMRLSRISLTNFSSHKSTEIDFSKDDHIVLIRGLNGSGKSYLMDSVPFALYGKVDRGLIMRPRQLVRGGAETASVIVDLEGKSHIQVMRRIGKKSSSVRLIIDGGEKSGRVTRQTQERIENALGFSYESFMSASYLSQGKVGAFTDGKSGDRVKILTNVLNLASIDAAAQSSKDMGKQLVDEAQLLGSKIAFLEDEADKLRTPDEIAEDIQFSQDQKREQERELSKARKLRDRLNKRAELQREYRTNRVGVRFSLEEGNRAVDRLQREIDRDVEERKGLAKRLKKLEKGKEKIARLKELLEKNSYPYNEVEEQVEEQAKNEADLVVVGEQISKLRGVRDKGGKCPTCLRDVGAGHEEIGTAIQVFVSERKKLVKEKIVLDNQNEELQGQIERHQEVAGALESAERRVSEAEFVKGEHETYSKRISKKTKQHKRHQSERDRLTDVLIAMRVRHLKDMAKFEDLDDEAHNALEDVQEEIDDLNGSIGKLTVTIGHLVAQLKRSKEIKAEIKEQKAEIKVSTDETFYYEYWADRFPKVKLGLIDSFVPQMEEVANSILDTFSPIRIELSTMMEKNDGGMMDRFRIVVYEGKDEREWENWSGGEKKQVAIAICLAMNTTLWNMGFGLDFILMDEVFADLDIEKRPKVLKYLGDSGRNVMVISHTDINPAFFDRVLTVTKTEKVSRIDG